MPETLNDLGNKFQTDKVTPGYLDHYEAHLGAFRDEPISVLEIGIASGASLRMWAEYFTHPARRVTGVDIVDPGMPSGWYDVVVSDVKQLDLNVLGSGLDVVIDDGSHYSQDIVAGFERLWPWVKPGGWYVIEDLGTQWWAGWGDSRGHSANGSPAIAMLRRELDTVLHEPGDVSEIHVYKYIIFLRKAA